MQRETRARLQVLERVLDRVAAQERRAIADLRTAGWDIHTLQEAREYRRTVRHLNQMSDAELIEIVGRDINRTNRRKTA